MKTSTALLLVVAAVVIGLMLMKGKAAAAPTAPKAPTQDAGDKFVDSVAGSAGTIASDLIGGFFSLF